MRGVIRSTVAHVDLAALQANFKAIQEFLKAGPADPKGPRRSVPRVIAVVKANAYGHGSERVALALTTSERRWERRGTWTTIFLMWRLRLAYALGADPKRLAHRYE